MNKGDEWGTPQGLFDQIYEFLGPFDMDGAATEGNTKLRYFTSDASMETWTGHVFLNPPYSKMKYFAPLAANYSHEKTKRVSMLCRFDASTEWWRRWVHCAANVVWMLPKRTKFVGAPSAYNFPTAVVCYNDKPPETGAADYRYFPLQ